MTVISKAPPVPHNYGHWWNTNQLDEKWYAEIYSHRPNAHTFFMNWLGDLCRKGINLQTVLEVGCGRGVPYAHYFKNYDYHGFDISAKEIEYCQNTYKFPAENFVALDVIKDAPRESFDLVFSHAVIDHVYDVNTFLQKLAGMSKKYLYVSAYYDWNPNLQQHKYEWAEEYTCYHNSLSPEEVKLVLAEAGFSKVEVFPVFIGRVDLDRVAETTIIAER